jgi:hypothetical protein
MSSASALSRGLRTPPRSRAAVLAAVALLAWGGPPGAGGAPAGPPPTLEDIAAGVRRQWDRIGGLAVDYHEKTEPLVEFKYVKKYKSYISTIERDVSFAFKGDKRYHRELAPPTEVRDMAPDVETDYDVLPGGKQIKKQLEEQKAQYRKARQPTPLQASLASRGREAAFDGKQYRQKEPGLDGNFKGSSGGTAMIADPSSIPDELVQLPQDYLANLFQVRPDAMHPQNDRKAQRLPDALGPGGYEVRPDAEEVDGSTCVVVARPGHATIWLDPKINYSVRKCELFDPESGALQERRQNREFVEVEPGIWLPRVCWRDECGPPLAPEPYRGKPLLRHVYEVKKVVVNDVPDSLFRLEIDPGVRVVDATQAPAKDGKPKLVTYEMPADAAALDETIRRAVKQADGVRDRQEAGPRQMTWIVAANAALLAIIGAVLAARYYLARRRPT